jgi:hypothetical protein
MLLHLLVESMLGYKTQNKLLAQKLYDLDIIAFIT